MENEEVSIRTLADSETETMSVKETIKKLKKLVLSP
jgi:threonyl-tRNA synthetase